MNAQVPRLVFGAHAAGKTTLVAAAHPGHAIGNRAFDASDPNAWRFFQRADLYEVAPMLPGAAALLDPRSQEKRAIVEVVNFSKLIPPPSNLVFIHVEPPYELHLERYIERDARRFGMSRQQADTALRRFRAYYRELGKTLRAGGSLVISHTV